MRESELLEWFSIADSDYKAAEFLQTMVPTPLEIICYHCQQAGEKCLKGFLCYHDKVIPKTHDLGELCLLCTQIDSEFEEIIVCTGELSFHGVVTRYPNCPEILESDMKSALKSAREICDFVKKKINFPQESTK